MKRSFLFWPLAASLLLLLTNPIHAGETVRYRSQPGGSVKIDGTSTIHDWTVESKLIGGYMQLDATFPKDPAKALEVQPKVEVIIPVRSLKSGKNPMDNVMYKSMNQTQHPRIEYSLKSMKLDPDAKHEGEGWVFDTEGELTVAGVKREAPLKVVMVPMEEEKMKVTGSTTLKMTDFGIKPPAPAIGLGLIKTGDEVKITFEWITRKSEDKN